MDISIRHPATLDNLNNLRAYLFRHPDLRRLTILINRDNGEISLMQPILEVEARLQTPKPTGARQQAILLIGENVALVDEAERDFSFLHLPQQAARVLRETLDVLNRLQKEFCDSTRGLLSGLGSLRLELPAQIEHRAGWQGGLSRQGAERLLESKNLGSYVLREGDIETREFEDNLAQSNAAPFRCYVMTKIETGHKISDTLLIQRREGWAIYNDDPKLSDYQYRPNLEELIVSLGALHPISK